ncbi:MAG TPA: methylmalonyl-CoA mutase family protein, partial [Myxococcota bacterium]|nr:methylmalonyl-CoA mutase family protein [Myxococcota bacterium]
MSSALPVAQLAPLRRTPSRVRVVTAASLFDGHDASINIIRRLLQKLGAEVVHLGHDRSVEEVVEAAIQEDADAVAVSSYQGGHLEYFRYLVDRLRERGAERVRVYGGGGGVIAPQEIEELHACGVARIFSPEDGRRLGLEGMVRMILDECRERSLPRPDDLVARLGVGEPLAVARLMTFLEEEGPRGGVVVERLRAELARRRPARPAPVVGFTGTGGAGKSSVVDEIVRRLRFDAPLQSVGILLVDPSRRRSGGALLGDRIRMNAIHAPTIFVRSLATRQAHLALSTAVRDAVSVLQAAGFDLVMVETAGIGQSDSEIIDLADLSVYVMTPEYGAPSQLEKIDMLELADLIVLNKSDRAGAEDALRDVRKQWRRNHNSFALADDAVPVFPTVASRWSDAGTDRFYAALVAQLADKKGFERAGLASRREGVGGAPQIGHLEPLIPAPRVRYLAEIAEVVRGYRERTEVLAEHAASAWALSRSLRELGDTPPEGAALYGDSASGDDAALCALRLRYDAALAALGPEDKAALAAWPAVRARYRAPRQEYAVRERSLAVENQVETLSHTLLPKVALPRSEEWGSLLRYLRLENLPGVFPFTAGVFPFKRESEDPTRMFAGEGTPERTNRRFHFLCRGQRGARLSTAFDSVTLYGRDPDLRPDIYGKIGNSGVSVCTIDDAKKLYSGFDLVDSTTSVSMTINGPAPILLAFFLNAAIDQTVEKELRASGGLEAVRARQRPGTLPLYAEELPQ